MQNQTQTAPLSAAQITELNRRAATKLHIDSQITALNTANAEQLATLQTQMNEINTANAAQISALQAQKSAIDTEPLPADDDGTRDQIGELFAQMLAHPACADDAALRGELYATKVKLLAAWDAGDMPVVALVLQTQELPAALEPFRAGALQMLGVDNEN